MKYKLDNLNQITGNIWLGNYQSASSKFSLTKAKITHILTVGSGLPPRFSPQEYTYLTISEHDIPSANLKQHFEKCHNFIQAAINAGGNVLVHCYAGISRSATIVISFLMKEYGLSLNDATKHTQDQRWFINPN